MIIDHEVYRKFAIRLVYFLYQIRVMAFYYIFN